jgi:membrane-bound lytic murein transglycosylase B
MRRVWVPLVALVLAGCAGSDAAAVPSPSAAPSPTATTTAAGTVAVASAPPSTIASAPTTSLPDGAPARIDPPTDAAGFAAAFDAVQRAIVDPASDAATVEAAGEQLQLLLRSLADRPELDEQVVLALSADVRPIVEPIIRARQFVQARSAADTTPTPPSPTLPAWTIRPPEPIDVLRSYYDEAEQLTGVPWYWLAAIHLQETRMGRIDGVSDAGAVGPMQFLPTTWAECCTGDPTVTRDAIIGAATYLAQSGAPGDMQQAVHQYNPNDSYVAIVTAYAETLRDQPAMYGGYHAFQVFAGSSAGTVRLPVGYQQSAPVDAATYLAEHPDDAA